MKINYSMGILFDSIYYSSIYFCKKDVLFRIQTSVRKNENTVLFHYHTFRSQNPIDPPPSLYPFFYQDKNADCLLTNFFVKDIDYFVDSIEDFFRKVSNRQDFRSYVFKFYFSKYKDTIDMNRILCSEGESLAKALVTLGQTIENMAPFIHMVYHFNAVVDELVQYMHALIPAIEMYHS